MGPEEKAARDVERVLAGLPGLAAAVQLAVRTLGPEHRAILRRTVQERPGRSVRNGGAGPMLEQAVGMDHCRGDERPVPEHRQAPEFRYGAEVRPAPESGRPADHPRSRNDIRHPRRPR